MRHQIYDEENLDLQDDENTEIYIGPAMNEQDEEDNDDKVVIENDSDYRCTNISDAFLRCELGFQSETDRTKVKFSYRGDVYIGVVLHKISKTDYIFLVQDAKVRNSNKVMKKIHIPDASLII